MGTLIKPRGSQTTASRGPSAQRFQYRPRTAEEVKARANRSIGARDSYLAQEVDFFTPPAGDNTVRILPPTWEGARHYGQDLHIHYGIGPDKNAYLCLDKMKGEACPICEERTRAASAEEVELSKALRPRQRVVAWVINRKEEGKGPLAWSMPAGLDKDIVNCSEDKQTGEYLAIDDPSENGYDVSFKRIGTDERTEYTGIQVARRPSPLSDDAQIAARWLEFVGNHPLPSLLQFRTYDEIKAAYAGTTAAWAEKRTDGQRPAGASGKVPARRATHETTASEAADTTQAAPSTSAGDKPSWDEIHSLNEDVLEQLIADFGLDPSGESFTSEQQVQDWICTQLEIAPPASSPSTTKGSWKDRLSKMRQGK